MDKNLSFSERAKIESEAYTAGLMAERILIKDELIELRKIASLAKTYIILNRHAINGIKSKYLHNAFCNLENAVNDYNS